MVKYQFVEDDKKLDAIEPTKLHPPQAPEKIVKKEESLVLDDAFLWLATNSSFQRSIVEFVKKVVPGFKGKYHRFSKIEMNKAFQEKVNEANEMRSKYGTVMKEFKLKLKKLQDEK